MECQNKSEEISQKLINKIKIKKSGDYITIFFYLMKELHLSYDDILEMPLSTINLLFQELIAHNEREEKASKRKR